MDKITFKQSSLFLFFCLLAVFLLANSYNYLDPDLGWHLLTGQEIWEQKEIPRQELHNYTLEGKTWVDHEWLLNLISFLIFDRLGYLGLNIFFVCIMLSVFYLLYFFCRKIYPASDNAGFFIFFSIFGMLGMAPHLGVRMQEITILLLLILLFIIYRFDEKPRARHLLWLIPLFAFWANVHAGFLIGLFVLGFYLSFRIAEKIFAKLPLLSLFAAEKTKTGKEIALIFLFFMIASASTLINPYGIGLYEFLRTYSDTYYFNVIIEWLPLYSAPLIYYQIVFAAIACSLFGIAVISAYMDKKRGRSGVFSIRLWHLVLAVIFILLAAKSRRHFPLFFIISFPLIIAIAKQYLAIPENSLIWIKKNRIIKFYSAAFFAVVIAYYGFSISIKKDPFNSAEFCRKYPCQAVDFLKNEKSYSDLKLLNNYSWGGFMLWVWPEKKLFMDGRLPIFPINGHSLLEEYNQFFKEGLAEKKLAEYGIEAVMLNKKQDIKYDWVETRIFHYDETKANSEKNHLDEYLSGSSGWKKVYEDDLAKIYIANRQ